MTTRTHFFISLHKRVDPIPLFIKLGSEDVPFGFDGKVAGFSMAALESPPLKDHLISGEVWPPLSDEDVKFLRSTLFEIAKGIKNVVVINT